MSDDPTPASGLPAARGVTISNNQAREDFNRIIFSDDEVVTARVSNREADSTDRIPPVTSDAAIAPATADQAGEAGELVNQESGETGPTRSSVETERGTPIDAGEEVDLNEQYRARGEARIRALTDLFGQDAFVLGHLLFDVPPLAIRIKKGNMTYRWKPLRTKESIAVKSGNGECYIEIDLAFVGLGQIQSSLAELIALWKKVPFCFIENAHIRKMMIPHAPDESMAVCLETLVMDAVSGKPNTVYATLLTRWFNYKPFSQNFWYRREWIPSEGVTTRRNAVPPSGPSSGSSDERTPEGNVESPTNGSPIETILVDLSSMETPEVLDAIARTRPPEVGLFESVQVDNPGDPLISGTYPVVYPHNSEPFLERVRTGSDRPARISSWGDGIRMSWNRFVRTRLPSNWRYADGQTEPTSIAADAPRDRGSEAEPPPVEGERDIVIFVGDSIMTAFTGQTTNNAALAPAEGGPAYGEASFFEWSGNATFASTTNFTYRGMFRNGATTQALLSWWNEKKEDPSLKATGNEESCSRVAGVVVCAGLYDGEAGPSTENLQTIMSEASGYGAIPIMVSLPPVADHGSVLSQLRLLWGTSEYAAYIRALPDHHADMVRVVEGVGNGVFVDIHTVLVEESFRDNRAAPLGTEYHEDVSGSPGYYAVVPNNAGSTAMGNYVHGNLPWNSLAGQEAPQEQLWTVCQVEDGDTVWVWGQHPDSGDNVIRNVRLKFIDTPETYHLFTDTQYDGITGSGGQITGTAPNFSFTPTSGTFEAGVVGQKLHITGASDSGNDGSWTITARPESSRVTFTNTHGVADSSYDGVWTVGGDNPMPEGQDSYRPDDQKYGLIAKNALEGQIPEGTQIRIDWHGTGYYGRYLGVLWKGEINLNEWMISQGHAFADASNSPEESQPYVFAEAEARGDGERPSSPRGVWAQRVVALTGFPGVTSVADSLRTLMRPDDYRTSYRAATDGGHGGTPSACTEGDYDQSSGSGDGLDDA